MVEVLVTCEVVLPVVVTEVTEAVTRMVWPRSLVVMVSPRSLVTAVRVDLWRRGGKERMA